MHEVIIKVIDQELGARVKRDPYADWEKAMQQDVERTRHWNSVEAGTRLGNRKQGK